MKCILYLYQYQLQKFINATEMFKLGIAYEWKGEDVYHAYLEYPQIAPSGYAVPCLFLKTQSISDFNNAETMLSKIGLAQDQLSRIGIVIVFCLEHDKLLKRSFVPNNDTKSIKIEYVPDKSSLYTRSKGLIEVGTLEKKNVLIIGLGSGGASIAVELAKAGVGNFLLVDFDRLELHNISRHIAGVNELGRLKTNIVRDAILSKNPYANITTYPIDMMSDVPLIECLVKGTDLIIAATDNLSSRYVLNSLIIKHKKVGLFGRAVTRAEGGDVLRVRPGGPCYACLKGSQWYTQEDEITDLRRARETGVIPAYTSEDDANALVQVGLSTDIAPINTMMVKLAIQELSRGSDCLISSLDHELDYDFYIWANRRELHFANWAAFNNNPGRKKPTILQWYGVKFPKNCDCNECKNY
jgi:molybdopterin/thiamine biosynthesis adenylyltransferase